MRLSSTRAVKALPSYPTSLRAFSLVEVVIAIGIFAFAIVAIIGLFSIGLSSVGDSEMKLQAGDVATQILQSRLAAPQLTTTECVLPPLQLSQLDTTPPAFGQGAPKAANVLIDGSGQAAVNNDEQFLLSYRMWKDTNFSPLGNLVRIEMILSWPPHAPTSNSHNQYDVVTSVFVQP